jgi:NADH dehydrogenase
MRMKRLIVLGGGFAGMWAALTAAREFVLAGARARVTLISRDPFLTVRPRLYEEFTDAIRAPLGPVLTPLGIELRIGEIAGIDVTAQRVRLAHGTELPYDKLVLALGSVQRPVPVPGAELAFDIDTFAGAARFDRHLRALARAPDAPGHSTFVIVGAGFTGMELAMEMRTRIRAHADAETAEGASIVLVDRAATVGPEFGAMPRPHLETALRAARVETKLGTSITGIEPSAVVFEGGERRVAATTVITTGLQANPLAAALEVPLDEIGRVAVDDALRVLGRDGVYAAGDIARAQTDPEHFALMSCQHAVPMGKHAGYNAAHALLGSPVRRYSQPNYVTCLDLGEWGALFTTGWERKPEQWGADVKGLKRTINTQWIYPPRGTREQILKAADLDAPWPPEA